jgi:hypothetical protein
MTEEKSALQYSTLAQVKKMETDFPRFIDIEREYLCSKENQERSEVDHIHGQLRHLNRYNLMVIFRNCTSLSIYDFATLNQLLDIISELGTYTTADNEPF